MKIWCLVEYIPPTSFPKLALFSSNFLLGARFIFVSVLPSVRDESHAGLCVGVVAEFVVAKRKGVREAP